MIHSFLLIGQSNMAGRGILNEVKPIANNRLKVLRNGRWQNMFSPVNPDRPFSGVCLAESFADAYSAEHNVDVGLIPCADGGTTLDQWRVGGLLYDHAVCIAGLASRTSTIAGVLWHQGESDCADGKYQMYEQKFTRIMNSFREDLGLYDVPFLLGGLGDFLANRTENPELCNYVYINETLKRISQEYPMTGFVSAVGLTANKDNLHFNAGSLREFGRRYYEEFRRLEDKTKVFEEKVSEDDAVRGEFENL